MHTKQKQSQTGRCCNYEKMYLNILFPDVNIGTYDA